MWDIFICHTSEDKDTIARPLAEALSNRGYKVWYDEFALTLGDNLRRSIDRGLAESQYGIVILSQHFFAKEWPQRELDGLATREIGGEKVILPIWHGVTRDDVMRFSPPLADKVAISTDKGLANVLWEIRKVVHENEPIVITFGLNISEVLESGLLDGDVPTYYPTLCDWLEQDLINRLERSQFGTFYYPEPSARNGETLSVRFAFPNLDLDELAKFDGPWWEILEIAYYSEIYGVSA